MGKSERLFEEDLYRPIYEYFTNMGYTVKSEVQYCDITAIKDDTLIIVEMKIRLNLELITQAALRQRITGNVYVAVPKPGKDMFSKRWKNLCYLLRRLELGLIVVSLGKKDSEVEVVFDPAPFHKSISRGQGNRKRKTLLKEFDQRYGDYNTGGSKGKKLATSYREKAIHIACCLQKYGPMSPKRLRELGTCSKKTTDILYRNYYGWFSKVARGIYELNEKGMADLDNFPDIKVHYEEMLNKNQGK
ncbi:MAG TPA: hypothetical protein GXX49_02100 [Clostridiaceae bacterium]|jgi:hypothetical protein|nr:hypothetical protein [Clostridiaceae bacterium]